MSKTSKRVTENVILSRYGRTLKSTLNSFDDEYFINECRIYLNNERTLYNDLINKRIKPLNLAKNLICYTINKGLIMECCEFLACTYKQVKNILEADFNYNIEKFRI